MTPQEATALMSRVASAYGRGFKTETMDEWRRHLERIDPEHANKALDRIIQAGEPGPSVARIIAEVIAAKPRHTYSEPIGDTTCQRCGGDGFTYDAEHRATPCRACRPDHPINNRLRAVP